jgi:glycosyltransferase involved in cell wall biosynthesis
VNAASPLVSVIVAAHDAEEFLQAAVRSVLRQTVTDLELLIVDDGSTDGTADLLRRIDDPRLVVLRNEEARGLAGSLNAALDQARGRYVARLDADDVALPRRLERQLSRMRSGSSVAIVGGGAFELGPGGVVGPLHLMPSGTVACRWASLFSSPFLHPSVLVDRDPLERHSLRYDTGFLESEDYDLWTRLLAYADGDNLSEPLVLYRVHAAQASQRRRDVQRDFQRHVAFREIGRYARDLSLAELDLVWRVGSGEPIEQSEIAHAADLLVPLVEAFEKTHRPPAARHAAARVLARVGAQATPIVRARLLRQSIRLDPTLPIDAVATRTWRRHLARVAERDAKQWLAELDADPDGASVPIRVTAVFPEPTPYRAPLLDRVAALPDIDLTVAYAAPTVAGRTWEVERRHRAVFLRGARVPGAEKILHHDYPVTPGITRMLGRARPDVVVVSGWSTFAAQAAITWCRVQKVPYVLVVESHDEGPRAGWRRTVKRTVVPPIVRGASGVLVTGTLARRSMEERGASPDRVGIFANTIDVEGFGERADRLASSRPRLREPFGAAPEDVVVLSVARLAPEKALDILVRAAAEADDPRLVLVIAGSGPERDRLAALADELGVRLVLAGNLPWDRIVEAYVAADVFALLSEREPWGVVVNEAAACGLPLVLSDRVGAGHDLLRDGENGVLVPAGDVTAAARALRRLSSDRLVRLSYGAESRRVAADWGYGPSAEAFRAAVRRAVSDQSGR